MTFIARLAALEQWLPPPTSPSDEAGPLRLPMQLHREWPLEQQREALERIMDEVDGYVCAEHPVSIVLAGEPAPAPRRCRACGGWNMIAMPTFPVVA